MARGVLLTGALWLTGCKQLFGPEDAGQGGAVNTGGAAVGAGGEGGSGASSMSGGNGAGGAGTGGAGTGGAECNFTPAAVPGGTCSGEALETHPLDETLFTGGVTATTLANDGFHFEPCSGFGTGTCGAFEGAVDPPDTLLRATPVGGTGYWADPVLKPTPFLYKTLNGAFVAVASVRVHSTNASGQWPGQPINLGGLLARGHGASSTCRPPWLKLEVGTLDSAPGIRSAWQGINTDVMEPHQLDVSATDVVPPFGSSSIWIDLALCRNSEDGQIHRLYRVPPDVAWHSEEVWPQYQTGSAPPPGEMAGAMDIGLVAAAYNPGDPDVAADFRYVAFHEYQRLCTCLEGLPSGALPQ